MFRFSSSKKITIFPSNFLKNLAFTISKHYFYNFNSSFYNTPNIKHSIFLQLYLNILSFNIFLHFYYYFSLSLYLSLPLYLHISQPDLEAYFTFNHGTQQHKKKKFKKKKKKPPTARPQPTAQHPQQPTTNHQINQPTPISQSQSHPNQLIPTTIKPLKAAKTHPQPRFDFTKTTHSYP